MHYGFIFVSWYNARVTIMNKAKKSRRDIIQEICINGIIAATYAVLTIAISPIAYGPIQFRLSEVMVLLCFFNKKYTIGLTLGCFLANCLSPTASLDIWFGTGATLLACLCMIFCKHLALAAIFPVISNAFIIGWELTYFGEPFWMSVLTVGIGELGVMIVAYVAFMLLKKNQSFFKAIKADQNLEFKF